MLHPKLCTYFSLFVPKNPIEANTMRQTLLCPFYQRKKQEQRGLFQVYFQALYFFHCYYLFFSLSCTKTQIVLDSSLSFSFFSHPSSVILLAYSTMLGFATSNSNLVPSGITWFVCFLTFCFFPEGKLLKGMAFASRSAVFLAPSMCLAHRGYPVNTWLHEWIAKITL